MWHIVYFNITEYWILLSFNIKFDDFSTFLRTYVDQNYKYIHSIKKKLKETITKIHLNLIHA